jgi:hypothetical protein
MASILTNNGKHVALDALRTAVTHLSLHSGDPSTTGANEISGGSPAYARKAVSGGAAASGGSVTISASIVFDVPAGTTVSYVGMWSASTAGTYYGHFDVTDEVFAGQGTYTLTTGTVSL